MKTIKKIILKPVVWIVKRLMSERAKYFISRVGNAAYAQCWIAQHIFRINSHVPWPCHWSSVVSGVQNIRMKTFPPFPGLGIGQYIQANKGIHIGANVRLGPGVKIISANHDLFDYERHVQAKPIKIGNNCWIGANAVILPGVELLDHVVVGAGAVVNKSFLETSVVIAGNPARVVKHLDAYSGNWDHVFKKSN